MEEEWREGGVKWRTKLNEMDVEKEASRSSPKTEHTMASYSHLLFLFLTVVGTNSGDLRSNSGDLGSNSDDLGSNSGDLGSKLGDLGSNSGDLGSNSGDLGSNSGDLGSNSNDLGSNSNDLGSNSNDLGSNANDLGSNSDHLRSNSNDLGSNFDDLQSKSRVTVSLTSPYCKQIENSFDCNFRKTDQPVFLDELPSVRTTKIFLHNAKSLTVAPKVCAHMAFFSVSSITFAKNHECPPAVKSSLKMVNSAANRIPNHVTRIEMEDSSVEVLDSDAKIESLILIRSTLGLLKIPHPIQTGALIKLEHSAISTMEELELENSQLLMVNTTIERLRKHGLQLRESSGTMWSSTIKETYDQAVLLGPKSTLTLKGIDGKITLVGAQESSDPLQPPPPPSTTTPTPMRSAPGVPPKTIPKERANTSCPQRSSIFWLLPTCLALVEAMIIIANCTSWFPALKGGRIRRGVEEGGRNPNILEGVSTSGPSTPMFYYSSDTAGYQNTVMRNRRDKIA